MVLYIVSCVYVLLYIIQANIIILFENENKSVRESMLPQMSVTPPPLILVVFMREKEKIH